MDLQPVNFRPIYLGLPSNKSPILFRSNELKDFDPKNVQWLRETMEIKTYVDLREKGECYKTSKLKDFYVDGKPLEKKKHKIQIRNNAQNHGFRYQIGFLTFNYLWNFMFCNLKWNDFWRMIFLLIRHLFYGDCEYQKHGGKSYLNLCSLGKFYCSILDNCKTIYRQIFYLMVNSDNFPMLIGCSFGKDRTGITSALVMALAGCDDELIISEYCKSEINLLPIRGEIVNFFANKGIGEHFCGSPPEAIIEMLVHLRNKYGSTEGYLKCCGLTKEQIGQIKRNLTNQ